MLVIDEEGIETLIPELLKGVNDSQVVSPENSFKDPKQYYSVHFKGFNKIFPCRHPCGVAQPI